MAAIFFITLLGFSQALPNSPPGGNFGPLPTGNFFNIGYCRTEVDCQDYSDCHLCPDCGYCACEDNSCTIIPPGDDIGPCRNDPECDRLYPECGPSLADAHCQCEANSCKIVFDNPFGVIGSCLRDSECSGYSECAIPGGSRCTCVFDKYAQFPGQPGQCEIEDSAQECWRDSECSYPACGLAGGSRCTCVFDQDTQRPGQPGQCKVDDSVGPCLRDSECSDYSECAIPGGSRCNCIFDQDVQFPGQPGQCKVV